MVLGVVALGVVVPRVAVLGVVVPGVVVLELFKVIRSRLCLDLYHNLLMHGLYFNHITM